MPDPVATSIGLAAEIGLLWLREKGGTAGVDGAWRLWVGLDACPIAFGAFASLERRGLVKFGAVRFPAAGILPHLAVDLTEAGRASAISDEAAGRYRRLMHGRFED